MTRDEERTIIERVQGGNADAFEPLVLENQKMVYNLALQMVRNEDDALDMSQEAFLRAYSSIRNFRGDSKFSVWLYRLTSNVCIDFLRSKRRKPTVSLGFMGEDGEITELEIPDARFSPEDEFERREFQVLLQDSLGELSLDYREILVMRELNGMSYDEIGKALSIEAGTVKSRLFRARKRLCNSLLKRGNISPPSASNSVKGS